MNEICKFVTKTEDYSNGEKEPSDDVNLKKTF